MLVAQDRDRTARPGAVRFSTAGLLDLTSPENKNHNPDTQAPTQCNIRFHLYEAPDVVKLRDGSRRVPAGRAGAGEG